jgi:hypothetical protein
MQSNSFREVELAESLFFKVDALVDAMDELLSVPVASDLSFGPSQASLGRLKALAIAVGLLSVSVGERTSELVDADEGLR